MARCDTIDPSVELLLSRWQREREYGTLEIKFEAGRVVLMKESRTIKPADYRNTRDQDEANTSMGSGMKSASYNAR